jgi:hypothetical protein
MTQIIEKFIAELQSLGLKPACMNDSINLEYDFEKTLQIKVGKLLNQYIGFWRSIAIEVNHDREKLICRYRIPFKLITGTDITEDELLAIADKISKQIGGLSNEH